jgi:hypothetical protein
VLYVIRDGNAIGMSVKSTMIKERLLTYIDLWGGVILQRREMCIEVTLFTLCLLRSRYLWCLLRSCCFILCRILISKEWVIAGLGRLAELG